MKCIGLSQLLADSCLHYQTTITNGAFLGSLKQSQGQCCWTETSAKMPREQALSFVLIHFQKNENNTSCKIAVKAISGLHQWEQSLGLCVGCPTPQETFTFTRWEGGTRPLWQPLVPCVLRQGRAHLMCTADQFLVSMLSFALRRLSHRGQIGPVCARLSRAIEHHLRRYPHCEVHGLLGRVRWVRSRALAREGRGQPGHSVWSYSSRFPGWGRLARINLESQNRTFFFFRTEAPKADIQFESAVSPCFGSWVISFWFCFIYSFILVNTNSLLPAAKSPEPSLLQHSPHPEPWQLLPCLKSLCAEP